MATSRELSRSQRSLIRRGADRWMVRPDFNASFFNASLDERTASLNTLMEVKYDQAK